MIDKVFIHHKIDMQIQDRRAQWRIVRAKRLQRKKELMSQGIDIKEIRRDGLFRRLKKEQQSLSKVIKHIERKINKKFARIDCEEEGTQKKKARD